MTPFREADRTGTLRVEQRGDDVRYRLPMRDLGPLRIVGWLLAVIASAVVGVTAVAAAMQVGVWEPDVSNAERLSLIGMAGLMLLLAAVPGVTALVILRSRTVVEVRGDMIRVTERAGWLWWSWRVSLRGVEAIELMGRATPAATSGRSLEDLCALGIAREFGKPSPVALGYWREVLEDLADRLAEDCGRDGERLEVRSVASKKLKRDRVKPLRWSAEHPPEQPPGSKVTLRDYADGFRAEVPPGSTGGCAGCSSGCGVILLAIAAAPISIVATSEWKHLFERLAMATVAAIAMLAAVGFLLTAWRYTRRRAVVEVQRDRLEIDYVGVMGTSRHVWSAAELTAVVCAPGGTRINDRRLYELQVRPQEGDAVGFLEGRDEDELLWLAYRVHHALGLAEPADDAV